MRRLVRKVKKYLYQKGLIKLFPAVSPTGREYVTWVKTPMGIELDRKFKEKWNEPRSHRNNIRD